ncbi:probable RNA polymerase II nuclear localization protein SLC7A6OS [Onthophagus taurus]|uniref:probable RNA polymerase II nuclear localization protein SLC7A6OS n=1 Tax=Onthophagus taurus TaxID=166361 RepID=UPI000C20CF4E|nr:probable RNA polymerase II nuclear localization protein SLC7A6OS [Onthophagus taurus]
MAAVIRIKRRLDEEPLDALILNCKKRKTDDNQEEPIATVLKLTATLNDPDENVFEHVKKSTKTTIEEQFKKPNINVHDKLRDECQLAFKKNRYKVVNLRRFDNNETSEENEDLTLVDVETDYKETPQTSDKKEPGYVYDLYYTNTKGFSDIDVENMVVLPWTDQLIYGSARDNGLEVEEPETDDSDSNAENNWRNDYPDEIDDITEEDILTAVREMDINGDRELSSDDEEEGYIYGIDNDAAGFEEDIDPTDVRRYGEMYARFKARVKKSEELAGDENAWNYEDFED